MTRSLTVSGLTENQERFCVELAKSGNGSDSYRIAFPNSKAKPSVINVLASKLMAQGKIKVRIAELRASTVKQNDMDLERWAKEVTRLATVDPRKLMHEDGRIKMPNELDEDTAAAVASFEFDVDGSIKYKFWSKTQALDMAARHQGAYEKDNVQRGGLFDHLPREVVKQIADRLKRLHDEKTIEGEVIKG